MGHTSSTCSKFGEPGQEHVSEAVDRTVEEENIFSRSSVAASSPARLLAARAPDFLQLPKPGELQGPAIVDVDQATKIEFLTDVEGNWEYFLRWVSMSETVYWSGEDRGAFGPGELRLYDDCILVFGGDAPDKGPGDIRFVRTLLSLKARYSQRVFIILGNRDINKLRFSAELVSSTEPFALPWDDKALSFHEWLKLFPDLKENEVSTMKWMLHYMGCQNTTFDTRRHELALLNPGVRVTDEDVVESFRCSVDPFGGDAWMLRLLEAGKLVVRLGDTLFTHGGVHEKVLCKVPNQEHTKANMSLDDWIGALNGWKDDQIKDFYMRPYWSQKTAGPERHRGAEEFILYGTPGFPDGASVVYYNPFSDGNPQCLDERTEDFLDAHRIRRLVTGHQPHGQSPTVVRHPRTGMLRVTGDTSYSNPHADKLFNPANMRGGAVSIIRVQGDITRIHGILADGRQHGFSLHQDATQDIMPDMLVGRQLTDGAWLKTVLRGDGGDCIVQAVLGRGFNLVTEDMHYGRACLKMKHEFAVKQLARPLSDILPEWLTTNTPRSMRTFGAEEDPHSRKPRRGITNIEYCREDFLTADTVLINVGGVVDKVRSTLTKTISRSGTDIELEKRIVNKINWLIDMGKRVLFLSNNSNDSRRGAAEKLLKKGINIPAAQFYKHVLNTSYTCAWFLKNACVTNPFIICSDTGILEELKEMGIKKYVATIREDGTPKKEYLAAATFANVLDLVKKAPDVDAVVVGWDQQLTTLKIDVATAYLTWSGRPDVVGGDGSDGENKHIPLISCSSDTGGILGTTPDSYLAERQYNDRMVRTVGNGLMAKIVCETAGSSHLYYDVGQPSELMLEALKRSPEEQGLGVNPKTAVLIGDVLSTDIAMANRGGMRSLLVFSGETKKADFFSKAVGSHECPTWILDAMADL